MHSPKVLPIAAAIFSLLVLSPLSIRRYTALNFLLIRYPFTSPEARAT
jgi:hypothetical protein